MTATMDGLVDRDQRARAASALDANLVVLAGAGTGKTRILIDRLTLLLLGEGISVEKIVALTFTKKAAEEMRQRLETRLRDIIADPASFAELAGGLTERRAEWPELAAKALEDIPKAQIGTIHGFASHLLRLYPLQANVDPKFKEDEGELFDGIFDEEWRGWIRAELQPSSARAVFWAALLRSVELDDLKDLAKRLCEADVDLSKLEQPVDLRAFARGLTEELDALIAANGVSPRAAAFNDGLDALKKVFSVEMAPGSASSMNTVSMLSEWSVEPPKGWGETASEKAACKARLKELRAVALDLARVDDGLLRSAVDAIRPLVERVRRSLRRKGVVSFQGLLVFARNLLRDFPAVRAQLQKQYATFLIDEFQDTDPLQGEILFYLSEEPGQGARDWRRAKLAPGRLFVVGDPKQSIYRFRGADIAAFETFQELILRQGGLKADLVANFRSTPALLHAVNGIFSKTIIEFAGVQPAYVPLVSGRGGDAPPTGLEMLILGGEAEERVNAEGAREREAVAVADWIETHIAAGGGALRYRDVALLFRSANAFTPYLDALKERGIPYLAEGEKFFYQTPEVTEFMNVLAAIADPADRLAFASVLRSSLGALTDRELLMLHQKKGFDYRSEPPILREQLAPLYAAFRQFHADAQIKPLGEFVREIFEKTWLSELMAEAAHGEQSVANLLKISRLADAWSSDAALSLKAFVRRFQLYREDEREEGENPLADVQYDAVKIMTIHKAKGLEFPVVIIPNMSAERRANGLGRPILVQTWAREGVGLRLARHGATNAAMIPLEDEIRRRDAAEEVRVFYVAATRAKERLVFILRADASAQSIFSSLLKSAGVWPANGVTAVQLENVSVPVVAIPWDAAELGAERRRTAEPLGPEWEAESLAARVVERRTSAEAIARARLIVSPTFLQQEPEKIEAASDGESGPPSRASQLGSLCHKVLEEWNFKTPAAAFENTLSAAIERAARLSELVPAENSMRELMAEAKEILEHFTISDIYAALGRATILGREIPFFYPLEPTSESDPRLMRGKIDVLYELDGRLVIADYKTSRVDKRSAADVASTYKIQSGAYREAVKRTLGREANFQVIFLRSGEAMLL